MSVFSLGFFRYKQTEYKKIREFQVLRNEEPFGYEYVLECKNCGRIIGEKVYVA